MGMSPPIKKFAFGIANFARTLPSLDALEPTPQPADTVFHSRVATANVEIEVGAIADFV
jgi:hypothetical protein